ncbi:uncharacterized protein LOC117134395 [Brassica rapa]|uniref:uncharacterized protein LOC106432016 n=1 Tax=Brassica napus TaxID=3708 RepID=UPI0006AB2DB5|nr:uncharacterized protein LOC106432016 [Brassica napus]XP_033148598.1 uncharacterized protein LOC117134395 [Brassica rapa]
MGSWAWRKLLKFRPLAKNFLLMDVKDGATARFWTDLWFPKGRLIEIAGELGTQKLGISRDMRICDVLREGQWRFRRCRDRHIQSLVTEIRTFQLTLTDGRDEVLWKRGANDYGTKFHSSETWDQIRVHKDTVIWSKIVWFPQGVPRFAFITWLAVKDRLATGHRTRRWGQPEHCLFCGEPDETRDHLFFACPYTFTLWLKMVGNLFGTDPDPDWDITLSTMLSRPYDRLTFILLRLVLQVTIYFIWRERNERKHGTSHKTVEQLAKLVDKTVRNRISSTKYTLSLRLQGLMIRWFAAHDTAN